MSTTLAALPPTFALSCPTIAPVAAGSPVTVTFGNDVQSPNSLIVGWSLDYGDGQRQTAHDRSSAIALFRHTYSRPGRYTPILTLTDQYGRDGTSSCDVSIVVIAATPTTSTFQASSSSIATSSGWAGCYFRGKPMWGRVKIVDSLADFNVEAVTSLPDLRVESVDSLASSCGRWQFVGSLPDFTIRIVHSLPDFTIEYVTSLPGRP